MNDEEFAEYRSRLTRTVRTKLERCPDEGCECVLWTGALDSSGYASFKMKSVVRIAHRYAYEKLVGPIVLDDEDDATIDHLCEGHRNCMNVNHMEVVSRSENSIRANIRKSTGYRRRKENK